MSDIPQISSPKSSFQILDEVTAATCALVVNEPFFGHFFSGILKEVNTQVNTMGIGPAGNQVKLYINPEFWTNTLTTMKFRKGLIKHEILHLVFKHIFRKNDVTRKDIYNIACDLVVNQYIRTDHLPEDRIHLGMFPDMGLEPDREAEYYYRELMALHQAMTSDGAGQPDPMGGEGDGGSSGGMQEDQNGTQGQGTGSKSWENLKDILNGHNGWTEQHELWNEIDAMPKPMQEVLSDSVDRAIMNSIERAKVKGWGDLPGTLRQYLKQFELNKRPEVNWKRVLRMFTESSSRTMLRNTVRRPSKRYGTTPGIKIRRRQKLLLAIDTSFSVTPGELAIFFNEIYHIWKRGADIMIVECDTEIASMYPYRGILPDSVQGRGGTDLNPPFKFANERFMPDALIYFTDGFAPAPTIRARFPVLWVISGKGVDADTDAYHSLPGYKVRLPGEED